jgi:cytochrome d ubiquinol oxidase subunit II
MTVVALIFVPIVIAYQIWMYNIFRHKTTALDVTGDKESY